MDLHDVNTLDRCDNNIDTLAKIVTSKADGLRYCQEYRVGVNERFQDDDDGSGECEEVITVFPANLAVDC